MGGIKKRKIMRVLMVLSRFDQTGMTTHTFHLASALVKLNVDVILLVGRTITNSHISLENLLYQKFIDAGILVVPFFQPNRRSLVSKIMSTIEIMYYMSFQFLPTQALYMAPVVLSV